MPQYFAYGAKETDYLARKDKRLASVIERIGPIRREVRPDLFDALMHSIVGQQIATKAQQTIWGRLVQALGRVTPATVDGMETEALQRLGLSFRKVGYMKGAARKVLQGELDVETLRHMDDGSVSMALCKLDGVGVWTAEMLMLFSLQRPDVFSFGDLAIIRGLRMVYRHKVVSRERFEMYRRRFSPYGSVASLYLWAVAGGALPDLNDPAAKS
ncbi:MAG: DNA-3-methyladenine glycosylase 2 family protein [Desulfovibrio sp.]|uniref:DNA-3-methyladenine glycosylase family protein n=1 Tax=Desulfovibrio sp. TaxID=885 RepID=UPI00135D6A58|nr:DNA-3-methyladenine glycosylase 2 family protein [Desulfovibrio sp.]MTJ91865.1 DNA-3-methyladenine glycosylase 2 family protein [Desulfovibrio sp.]